MTNLIRINFLKTCVCVSLLQGCGGLRFQTSGEFIEQIKSGGKYDSEHRCDKYLRTSIEYQYCQQEVRKVYDEIESRKK